MAMVLPPYSDPFSMPLSPFMNPFHPFERNGHLFAASAGPSSFNGAGPSNAPLQHVDYDPSACP
jgi:hypothetical protein